MKTILKSIKITIAFCAVIAVSYVFVLWIFAQLFTSKGNADVVTLNGKVVGASLIGQNFTKSIYFWGRPSNAGKSGYDASSSSGSNKGTTNPDYLKDVSKRVDTFLINHPYLHRNQVPAEMVTASGSGLDPDITPESAYAQIKRVARARNMNQDKIKDIVDKVTVQSLLGPATVNVLKLNIALDKVNSMR